MILYFAVENFKAFKSKIEIDFRADMRIKRLGCNTIESNNLNIKKVIGIHGPNNTGKTCVLLAMSNLANIMVGKQNEVINNIFNDETYLTKYSVQYESEDETIYEYNVTFNSNNMSYESESLYLINYSTSNTAMFSKKLLFEKEGNLLNVPSYKANTFKNIAFSNVMPFIMALNFENNIELSKAKKDYIKFASSVELVKMGQRFDLRKTISLMKNDELAFRFINEFVKNCDLNIQELGIDEQVYLSKDVERLLESKEINSSYSEEDLKLWSKHYNKKVPSILIDSEGTNKIMIMAAYIYEAITQGKILLLDEVESSLHHIITKSIIALFNNALNERAQLIFTTHDALLLDIRWLLRKDQIYLTDIDLDSNTPTLKSFYKEFPANKANGIRGNEDISSYYLKGQFGAIPTVDLFEALELAIDHLNDKKD